MQKTTVGFAVLALALLCACSSNRNEPTSLKAGAREVGTTVGTAAREVGHGVKKAGKEIGEAAKEGGRAFRDAVRGEDSGTRN